MAVIHTFKPFDTLLLGSIGYPIYEIRNDIPKEFLIGAYGELGLSKVYASELMFWQQPFIY